jgi:gluconate 5-dehydrogenase
MSKPHALIIGASSAIGFSSLQRLKSTYNISALARRVHLFDKFDPGQVNGIACDVQSQDAIETAFQIAVENFGKISILLICAGVQLIKPIRSLKVVEIRNVIDVNFAAQVVAATLFASQKYSEKQAVMCVVSSVAASKPEPGIVLYSATKAASEALVIGLARELAPRRVVGVAPGWLDTEMTRAYKNIYTPAFVEELRKKSPVGIATVEDVVDCIEFLVSDKAKLITGRIIIVDGGASL